MVQGVGFMLLVSLVIQRAVSAVGSVVRDTAGEELSCKIVNLVISFAVITCSSRRSTKCCRT